MAVDGSERTDCDLPLTPDRPADGATTRASVPTVRHRISNRLLIITMLAVMLAIRTHDEGAMRAAASRCVAWSQRSQILRVALLQDGFSLSQRARALRVFAEVYSAQLLRLGQPPRPRGDE